MNIIHLVLTLQVCCPPPSDWSSFSTLKPSTFPTGPGIVDSQTTAGPNVVSFSPPPLTVTQIYDIPETYGKCPPTIKAPDKDSLCCGKESSSADRIVGKFNIIGCSIFFLIPLILGKQWRYCASILDSTNVRMLRKKVF